MRSLAITSGTKKVEYFPEENIIIKGSGSAMDPLDMTGDDTDIYSDDENPKEKKIANKIIDYSLGKRKLIGDKLKVKRSKIKHKVLIPGDKNMNREKLVKSELEYSDYSESEEETSSIKEEDRSLIKRRDTEDDDDGGEEIKLHDNSRIKDSTKISIPSEDISYGNSSNDSKENSNNNNKNTSISNMLSLKTLITSFIFMGLAITLQEAYSFTDGNNTVHSFLDSSMG
jgi:hypothetical protein